MGLKRVIIRRERRPRFLNVQTFPALEASQLSSPEQRIQVIIQHHVVRSICVRIYVSLTERRSSLVDPLYMLDDELTARVGRSFVLRRSHDSSLGVDPAHLRRHLRVEPLNLCRVLVAAVVFIIEAFAVSDHHRPLRVILSRRVNIEKLETR